MKLFGTDVMSVAAIVTGAAVAGVASLAFADSQPRPDASDYRVQVVRHAPEIRVQVLHAREMAEEARSKAERARVRAERSRERAAEARERAALVREQAAQVRERARAERELAREIRARVRTQATDLDAGDVRIDVELSDLEELEAELGDLDLRLEGMDEDLAREIEASLEEALRGLRISLDAMGREPTGR